ncbi:MAG TPA: hypothetical protein VGK67_19460 [Myxococcales bacterium]
MRPTGGGNVDLSSWKDAWAAALEKGKPHMLITMRSGMVEEACPDGLDHSASEIHDAARSQIRSCRR